jgi:hypothetical protein
MNKNIKDFIDNIIQFDNIDDILDEYETQSQKGYIFERLWDICIKLGFCPNFPNSEFVHKIGNSNMVQLTNLDNLNKYFSDNKVFSGNSTGSSDITLQNKTDNTYIFISSKYPKTSDDLFKQKSVEYYDIQNIIAMATKHKDIYHKYIIYLVVPDKKKVLYKVKMANKSSKYITDHMDQDNILDKTDLNKCFLSFKNDILKNYKLNKKINFNKLYLTSKENLVLRFHQELITQKTSDLIDNNNKSFLWGCKCRSGKTYMFGGIIIKQFNSKKKLNVLIITPAPTETIPQFTQDLFDKFKDFDSFKINHIDSSNMIDNLNLNLNVNENENNILIMSKQLLQNYINNKTILKIRNLKLDIIAFDENHFTGTTDLSKDILNSYSSKNTVKIYMTATYHKPLKEWAIPIDCQMYWDIEDEQICKSIIYHDKNIDRLQEKHGLYVTKTINHFIDLGYNLREIFEPYEKMPDLYLITNIFDSKRYEIIKQRLNSNSENKLGFCFETLFALNKNKTQFYFQNEVKTILRYISSSHKELDGEKTIFSRINKICSEKESRIPFTQIWFLPSNNINEISQSLIKLMSDDLILKKYDIMCINRKNKDLAKDIKNEINIREIKAKANGKNGLILLAGNMLTLGITLNNCDLVILMNNTLSSDKVLQQMYRCMTESDNKKIGFVIDLNISRVLNTCVNYTIYKNDMNIDDKMKYLIEHHLINIDVDLMDNKKINIDTLVKKLMDIWKQDPINSFRTLLRNLDNNYEEFDSNTQKLINDVFIKSVKEDRINATLLLKDDNDQLQILPSGREIIKEDKVETIDEIIETIEKIIHISFTKDVLPYIIPLTCILTIKDSNMDFLKMLMYIKSNSELLEIFDDQCLIWWNKKDLIDLINKIVSRFFIKSSNIFNISVKFKMSLKSLIDNPKELLELIADCLKPKYIEKKQYGEVFTPMKIVNEMLDQLPINIWKNKDLKWFDPAAGMGNFPIAVYLRLMESLKDCILSDINRKKHILENMLYMSELNKKNVLICNQIFDINNDYHLNLHQGDTLELNPIKTFKVKQFDIILGNPPYNKGGIRSHSGKHLGEKNETIWTKFVEKSFKWLKPNGYLLFINPLSWLKKSHSLHDILEKRIIWMKLWDNSQSKTIINADIPISLYVLQNSLNNNQELTKIISILRRRDLIMVSNVYLNPKYSIPLAYHSIFNKLIKFIEDNKLQLEFKTKTAKAIKTKTKIPENYELKDMLAVDTYIIKDGIMVKRMSEIHPDANKRKIIIANKASFIGAFIDDGKLGLTGNHKFYILGDKLELLIKILNFKISKIISHYTKYGQDFLDSQVLSYIPDIRKLNLNDINEDDFYKLIGLTKDEIMIIN